MLRDTENHLKMTKYYISQIVFVKNVNLKDHQDPNIVPFVTSA
jgi:hypothetical protein